MDVAAIITAVSGLGPLVASLGNVIRGLVLSRKADEGDIDALREAIEGLQDSLQNVRTLADALEDYRDLWLDIANVTGSCTRLLDYVRQSQSELRQGEKSPAWQAVDSLMETLDGTTMAVFAKVTRKIDRRQVDLEDSGRLKQAIDNFGESHTQVCGFVETRTPAGMIGQLTNMRNHARSMQRSLDETSHKLIDALRLEA